MSIASATKKVYTKSPTCKATQTASKCPSICKASSNHNKLSNLIGIFELTSNEIQMRNVGQAFGVPKHNFAQSKGFLPVTNASFLASALSICGVSALCRKQLPANISQPRAAKIDHNCQNY